MSIEAIASAARTNPELISYQHFEVAKEIYHFSKYAMIEDHQEFYGSYIDAETEKRQILSKGNLKVPVSARIPASRMTLTFDFAEEHMLLALRLIAGKVYVDYISEAGKFHRLFRYSVGGSIERPDKIDFEMPDDGLFEYRIVYLLALMNEPRVVGTTPMGSRQQRRAAHRGMGFAVDAWTRVSWDLSKETIAKISRDPTFHKVALHWRRGHFRRAESHFKGAIRRPDAIRHSDRPLWWQWIDGQWVGHPAFGFKKSVHAPKLSTGQVALRRKAA